MTSSFKIMLGLLAMALPMGPLAAMPANPLVERIAPDRLKISWSGASGVDVYVSDRPDRTAKAATLISADDSDGQHEFSTTAAERRYFLLRDRKDRRAVRVAERLLPLEHGSNFRDIGGYPAAGGKHVRWGMIYRSGATPLLTDADLKTVEGLHLTNMVDLRSSEERQLAPSRIDGVPYAAVGYSMSAIIHAMRPAAGQSAPANGSALYRSMPDMLAPQMRILFDRLLAKQGPLVYNCSAGQDRTGFASALILSALGVPREVIVADYHLSTGYRRPEYEMAQFDPAAFPDNIAAKLFAHAGSAARKAAPLREADGTAFLTAAFDEIDRRYGSVPAYLDKVVGVSAVDIAALRAAYLE